MKNEALATKRRRKKRYYRGERERCDGVRVMEGEAKFFWRIKNDCGPRPPVARRSRQKEAMKRAGPTRGTSRVLLGRRVALAGELFWCWGDGKSLVPA